MTNPSYFPSLGEIVGSLQSTGTVRGVVYNNILLSGAGLSGRYDPHMVVEPDSFAVHVPSIMPDMDPLTAVGQLKEPAPDVPTSREIRGTVAGLYVGRAVLARIPNIVKIQTTQFDNEITGEERSGFSAVSLVCAVKGLPLAFVQMAKVRESKFLEVGSRVATLDYPNVVHPSDALKALKDSVHKYDPDRN